VLTSASKPLLQYLERWRHDEHRRRLDPAASYLPGPLHVNYEHHVMTGLEQSPGIRGGRSVEVAEHVGPLQEFPGCDHRLESSACNKIIVHAVDFPIPRGPGRIRARHLETGCQLDETLDERCLSST